MLPLIPLGFSADVHLIKPLADSISSNGMIEPIIIRKNSFGKFELVAGYKRLCAAKTLGLRRVPCILTTADDLTASLISLEENLNRSSPDYFERAEMFKRISVRFGIGYEDLAERAGMSQSALCNLIKLLSLSEAVREKLLSARLDEKYALTVSLVPESRQLDFIDKIVRSALTPERAKELLTKEILPDLPSKPPADEAPAVIRKSASWDVRIFSNSLTKLVKTLNNSGIEASSQAIEKEDYIEYTVKIPKPKQSPSFSGTQNKINPICSFVP